MRSPEIREVAAGLWIWPKAAPAKPAEAREQDALGSCAGWSVQGRIAAIADPNF